MTTSRRATNTCFTVLIALLLSLVSCGGDDNASGESAAAGSDGVASTANPSAQLTAPANAQPDFPSSLDEDEYDRLDDELDSLPDRVIPRVEDDDKLHFASTAEAAERIVELIEAGEQGEADKVYASVDATTRNDLMLAISEAQSAARRKARDSENYAVPYRYSRFLKIDYGSLWQLDAEYIHGRVSDADTGAPVNGAELRMHPPYATVTQTDSDGRYSLLMPQNGAGVDVTHPNYKHKFVYQTDSGVSLKPADLQGQPVDIRLAASNAVPRPDLPSLTLRGRIVDAATGEPVAGLPVSVAFDPIAGAPEFGLKTMAGDYIRETDTEGRFAVTDLPVDKVRMLVQGVIGKKMYVLKQDVFQFEDSVERDFEVAGRELSLQVPLIVVGTVRDRTTGEPINGAKVSAGGWKAERTGERGQFLMQLDLGKNWELTASHEAYHSSSPKPFSSAVSAKIETEFLLDPITTGTILGTAVNAVTGEPIVNAIIEIAGQRVKTDANGKFRAEEIEAGEVTVNGAQSGYRADSKALLLEALQTAEATLELEPITTGTIVGIVVEQATGRPIQGASVQAGGEQVSTGDDGRFTLENVESGVVGVAAGKPLYVPGSTDVRLEAMASAEARIELEPITWGTVRGSVRDASSKQPLAGADVRIGGIKVTTDSDGNFVAERVPAGEAGIVAGFAKYHDAQARIDVPRDGDIEQRLELSPVTTGTVYVTVRNQASGQPVAGADVIIGTRRITTDASGNMVAEEVPAGRIVANASAQLFEPGSSESVLEAAGESRLEITLIPITYGTVFGVVTNKANGQPLANVTVKIGDRTARTNAQGEYRAERVPAGAVSVSAELLRYRGDQQQVQLERGKERDVGLALDPITTGTLQGVVRNAASGQALSGVTVSAGGQSTRTGADGRYELENVAAGEVLVGATQRLFEPGQSNVRLPAAGTATADFSLTPITWGTIKGVVFDANSGAPIAGVAVGAGQRSARTNSAGEFELKKVPAGEQSVNASKSLFVSDSKTVSLAADATETVTLRLQAITWGSVVGEVVDSETGKPIAGAKATVSTRSVQLDAAARFRAEKVPAGNVSASASAPGYESSSVSVRLAPDQEVSVTLALVAIKIGDITGQVVDAKTGEPIAQARVTVGRNAAESDSAGRFSFKDVPVGRTVIAARHADYANGSASADVAPAASVAVVIKLDLRREDVTSLEAELASKGTIDLYGIYFDSGKAQFKPSSLSTLRAVLEVMKRAPDRRFRIAGHTDADGGFDYNQGLSERRANTVIQWLIDNGIDSSRLEGVGFGEAQPAAPNDTESGKALNRRVQLSFAGGNSP